MCVMFAVPKKKERKKTGTLFRTLSCYLAPFENQTFKQFNGKQEPLICLAWLIGCLFYFKYFLPH